MSIQQLQNKLEYANRRVKYAWAKYFETIENEHNGNIQQYNLNQNIISSGVDDLPIHIVNEIEKLNIELKRKLDCPICMDIIQEGKLKITGCGHKFCKDCYDRIDECSICRRKINKS